MTRLCPFVVEITWQGAVFYDTERVVNQSPWGARTGPVPTQVSGAQDILFWFQVARAF